MYALASEEGYIHLWRETPLAPLQFSLCRSSMKSERCFSSRGTTGGLVTKVMLGSPCLRRRGHSAIRGIYRNVVVFRPLAREVSSLWPSDGGDQLSSGRRRRCLCRRHFCSSTVVPSMLLDPPHIIRNKIIFFDALFDV
jgi:hypothetical protein